MFLINICKFNGCGITFPSLGDLIQHIEDTHIDYDPKVIEQKEQAQPACLPLSYVLRFITDAAARKEAPFLNNNTTGAELKRKLAIKHHSYSMSSSNRSNTPTGSELDEDEIIISESEDSNDSWTTEEFSSEFIMRYGSRHSGTGSGGAANEKPFACPVPGCKKRYKNVNGIKYHSKNGHKKDGKVRKGYKCHCGKSYKTAQGLKSHALGAHNSTTPENVAAVNVTNITARSTSPSQSVGSLSPSSISNLSGSSNSGNNFNSSLNQSQQQSPNSSLTSAANQLSSSLMRSNIGLISIKPTSKPNLVATAATTAGGVNKILKLTSDSQQQQTQQQHETAKIQFENSSKISLPGLVNLGILTPTSPKIQQQHSFQQQQQPTHLNSNGNGNSGNNQGNQDNLPLTPISPNVSKSGNVSYLTATAATAGGGGADSLNNDET